MLPITESNTDVRIEYLAEICMPSDSYIK